MSDSSFNLSLGDSHSQMASPRDRGNSNKTPRDLPSLPAVFNSDRSFTDRQQKRRLPPKIPVKRNVQQQEEARRPVFDYDAEINDHDDSDSDPPISYPQNTALTSELRMKQDLTARDMKGDGGGGFGSTYTDARDLDNSDASDSELELPSPRSSKKKQQPIPEEEDSEPDEGIEIVSAGRGRPIDDSDSEVEDFANSNAKVPAKLLVQDAPAPVVMRKGDMQVFRDDKHRQDQVGKKIYDIEERFQEDQRIAEEKRKTKLELDQRKELEKQTHIAREFALFAEKGEVFVKHSRKGYPHARRITVILLKDHKTVECRWGPKNKFMLLKKNDAVLLDGKQTKVFMRSSSKKCDASLCFSLANQHRTLDVEARSHQIKQKWFRGLKLLVLSLHHS
jgi:hypothetical protein